ncbi:MAG: DUF4147 domain-containing protein [Patescibacteria group bacterium]
MGHRIQNFEALTENDIRLDALSIAEAGYAAIDIGAALTRTVLVGPEELQVDNVTYNLAGRKIFFVGVGKCAFVAAEAVEKLLGEKLISGIALDVSPLVRQVLTKIERFVGTHPLPSEANVQAAQRIMEFLADRTEDDLVIMLISGGGSTLLCLPAAPMIYLDESTLWSELTAKGATIQDINTVRKHISQARGGALAKVAYPAEVISLIVSDVPGNDIEFISSGPTVMDSSTIADAQAVLAKYEVTASPNIVFIETPKEQKYFERVTNVLFLTNHDALSAMKEEAGRHGYAATIVDDHFTGEAREVSRTIVEKLHSALVNTVLLYAGESTVTLSGGAGAGGRNQEMALVALEHIRDDELVVSFASDGHDNTDHAGAIADKISRTHAQMQNLSVKEYLENHRSYDFFSTTSDALVTGYTGSNVSDFIIALKK